MQANLTIRRKMLLLQAGIGWLPLDPVSAWCLTNCSCPITMHSRQASRNGHACHFVTDLLLQLRVVTCSSSFATDSLGA
jgi:hypothetical protein